MTDIVERLRSVIATIVANNYGEDSEICDEAADEIERLREALSHAENRGMELYDENVLLRSKILSSRKRTMNIPQNNNPAQPDGNSASHNAHAPDAPDSQASRKKGT